MVERVQQHMVDSSWKHDDHIAHRQMETTSNWENTYGAQYNPPPPPPPPPPAPPLRPLPPVPQQHGYNPLKHVIHKDEVSILLEEAQLPIEDVTRHSSQLRQPQQQHQPSYPRPLPLSPAPSLSSEALSPAQRIKASRPIGGGDASQSGQVEEAQEIIQPDKVDDEVDNTVDLDAEADSNPNRTPTLNLIHESHIYLAASKPSVT